MTRRRTVVSRIAVVVSICVVLSVAVLFLSSGKRSANILKDTAFVPKQSLAVGSTANLVNQAKDMNNKTVDLDGRKILVFSSKACGSCLYLTFPLIEWVQKFKGVSFDYIEKTDQIPLIGGELKSEPNFHVIHDSSCHFFGVFGEPSTPSIFFLDADNKVVWKNTGFVMTDYKRYEQRIREFSQDRTAFDDYQENINVGEPFPKIVYNGGGTSVRLPSDFLGKPTLIFFLYSSSRASKNILDYIPPSIADDVKINKLFVFAGITDETVKRNLDFARHFFLKDVELEAEQSKLSSQIDLAYVLSKTKGFKSSTVIEDDFFEISNRIALVGGPYMCMLDTDGNVLGINGVRLDTTEEYVALFKECAETLKKKGGDNT
jgi:hypothetical protein